MKKVVLVTGGSRGIGKAISEKFAKNGHIVIINYNSSQEEAREIKKNMDKLYYNSEIYKCDITKYEEVKEMIEYILGKYKRIDVLINNAGISEFKLFTDISVADWNNIMDTNLNGMFYCCKEVVGNMISNKSGKIINISSIWGIVGASCEVHYSVAKAGVIGLTKALAKELAPSNINVNCIAPGMINTDMNKDLSDDEMKDIIEEIPLMKIGTPKDVAELAYFLSTEKSKFITGQTISTNGGSVV